MAARVGKSVRLERSSEPTYSYPCGIVERPEILADHDRRKSIALTEAYTFAASKEPDAIGLSGVLAL